jgi:asparagine synthase (glutamine-hydrolysing)
MSTSAPEPSTLPSVLGDFLVAWGPDPAAAARWLGGLDGFTLISAPGEPAQAAVRGAVQQGSAVDGSRWVALADLIEGRLEEGARALTPGRPPPHHDWRGRFVQTVWHSGERRLAALTDHFSTLSLYSLVQDEVLLVGTDLRLLASSPWCSRTLDLESVYHYLNFAVVPAPRTIFRDIRRLEPSTRLIWQHPRPAPPAISEDRYYLPEYPEDLRGSDDSLAQDLSERIVATVKAYRPADGGEKGWGCFLSGGTDSSSIVSILARDAGPRRVRSFSIGFAEAGYDELGFAGIAAQACGADPSFARVSREQAQALIPRVVESYDQPFGNASAIPTLACADLAHQQGMQILLAGDGGDEIFGGNQRYAKDKVMETWFALPSPVKALGRAVGGAVGGSTVHLLNRVENFFERASLPNPDRFYTDDSFASDHYHELLRPEFRKAVTRDASLDFMRAVYRMGRSGGPLHRVMRLDLLMAIAQNDLRKVHGATRSASVSVRFPYLDPQLLAYTARLPERHKVRGLTKRYLFRRAMRGILPQEILQKKKQGFGLPIAIWLRSDRAFQSTVRDVLFDGRARARGWWEPAFVERLLTEHERGSWDHADHIWRLFVLELWLRRYVDAS